MPYFLSISKLGEVVSMSLMLLHILLPSSRDTHQDRYNNFALPGHQAT